MTTRQLAVVSGGLSQPSSTRMLADKIADAVTGLLGKEGIEVERTTVELRDHAHDITNNMLTGFPSASLETAISTVTGADGLIAVTPIFTTSYSGLFKSFFDVIDNESIGGIPMIIGATAGSPRHSLALDYALRPLFTYLHAVVAPTGVFAASEDWGSGADALKTLPDRIDRAAAELARLMVDSDRSSRVKDPFDLSGSLSRVGGFQPR
ncbi:FMN reductase [Okibacterium endophyticum]